MRLFWGTGVFPPGLSGGDAELSLVEFEKVVAVAEAGRGGDLVDGEVGFLQQGTGVAHAQLQQILDRRGVELLMKFAQELVSGHAGASGEQFESQLFVEVLFHVFRSVGQPEIVEKARKFALEGFVKSLLPVVDALDRALALSDRDNPATKATLDGVEGTLQLFLKELSNHGVERVDPEGQPFDPNVHQAISMAESATVPANHVLHVMQPGYLLNGRVVRPAMVVVAKAPAMTQTPESGENRINVEA